MSESPHSFARRTPIMPNAVREVLDKLLDAYGPDGADADYCEGIWSIYVRGQRGERCIDDPWAVAVIHYREHLKVEKWTTEFAVPFLDAIRSTRQ